jgi:hypothetical protein
MKKLMSFFIALSLLASLFFSCEVEGALDATDTTRIMNVSSSGGNQGNQNDQGNHGGHRPKNPPPVEVENPEDPPVEIENPDDPPPIEVEDPEDAINWDIKLFKGAFLEESYTQYGYKIFRTEKDVDDYLAFMEAKIGSNWKYSVAPVLSAELLGYGANFFKSNNLVMIAKSEGSSGNVIEVESVVANDNELLVKIIRTRYGMTCDMAYWTILIPVEKNVFNGDTVIVETPLR